MSSYNKLKDLIFGENIKYKLICIYDFQKGLLEDNNHFRGVFLLNSKFFLVDDLLSTTTELKNDFIIHASCIIYYRI